MRTLTVILIGLAIAAGLVSARTALKIGNRAAAFFSLLWLAFCAVDTYIGTTHGYSLTDELVIHALIFVVPTTFAWALQKYLSRRQS